MSFLDIARNPLLARAARAELHAGTPEAAAASASAAAGVPLPEAEVAPFPAVHVCAQACIRAHDTFFSKSSLHACLSFLYLGALHGKEVLW